MEVARRLVEGVDNIFAIKLDIFGAIDRRITSTVKDHWATFMGGQKQNHLDVHPYDCYGYLSTFVTFKLEIAHCYWKAIQSNDMAAAAEVINKFDRPFLDHVVDVPGGFDAGIHGIMEIFGIARRWRRKPYHSLTDQEMERLSGFCEKLGILQ